MWMMIIIILHGDWPVGHRFGNSSCSRLPRCSVKGSPRGERRRCWCRRVDPLQSCIITRLCQQFQPYSSLTFPLCSEMITNNKMFGHETKRPNIRIALSWVIISEEKVEFLIAWLILSRLSSGHYYTYKYYVVWLYGTLMFDAEVI